MKLKGKYYPRSFNMGISRELWVEIGGFCDLRHGQDIEFSNRIIKSGVKIVNSSAFVYHKRRASVIGFFKQTYKWGRARVKLYRIDKDMLCVIHLLPVVATIFFPVFLLVVPLAMIGSVIKYREIKPALWLPLVIPAQFIGYGLGFMVEWTKNN